MSQFPPTSPVAAAAGLDPDRLGRLVADGLMPMDDGELFLEVVRQEQLTHEDGRLKVASRETRQGFGLRAVSGERVGLVTSGFWSFTLNRSVALAYLRADLAGPGNKVEVEVFGDLVPATVGKEPLYDPENARLQG